METVIELKNVSKHFKNKVLLEHVTLSIQRGQVIGFVGSNGAGKSVLFKLISGIYTPDSGRVMVNGRKLGQGQDFPDNVGILIDSPGLIERYSGTDNLRFLAGIKNNVGDKEIEEAMELVGLSYNDKKPVKKYSLGMKQKLGIAQAIMENQDILLLDEPFNSLDYATCNEIRAIVQQMKESEKTVLLTSHHHSDLEKLCDKIYLIRNNTIETFTDQLKKQYFK